MRWLDGITIRLNGHEFEQTPGNTEGQGSPTCGSPEVTESQTQIATKQPQKEAQYHLNRYMTAYKWFKLSCTKHLGATAYSRHLIHL